MREEITPRHRARPRGAREEGACAELGRGLFGVVFCGGESRRMGRDKARLELGGSTLLQRAAAVLAEVTPRVLLACGPRPRYGELGLERVLDRRPGGGPLAGLEAALARAAGHDPDPTLGDAGERWVLALACDLPRARPALFRRLLERAQRDRLDACLFESDGGLEPLLAVYRTSCLESVRRALDAGERKMTAFHSGYGRLAVDSVPTSELGGELEPQDWAANVNTPAEWQREREVGR